VSTDRRRYHEGVHWDDMSNERNIQPDDRRTRRSDESSRNVTHPEHVSSTRRKRTDRSMERSCQGSRPVLPMLKLGTYNDSTCLRTFLSKVASRLEALGYGELENDWDDVGRRRDKLVKTAGTSEADEKLQLTSIIQDLKKELTENRLELGRMRKDRVSYRYGSGCVAGMPGEAAFAEPARPAQFLDHQFTDMSVGGWRAPPPVPYPVYPFPVGSDQLSNSLINCPSLDYRRLNDLTYKDSFPLPRIDTCLHALGGSIFFSTMGLRSGFWQVATDPRDADKTAFVTRKGQFRFKVLSFGLANSPSIFQRLMSMVLAGLNWDVCLVYIDDIIVMGRSFDDHLRNVAQVFQRLRQAGLKLKTAKCKMFQERVTFLGHVVSRHGISPDPEKVSCIAEWPEPKCLTELRSFLGLASYYKDFVDVFGLVALHSMS